MSDTVKRALVLISPRASAWWSKGEIRHKLRRLWRNGGIEVSCVFSRSIADGRAKARQAVADGMDAVFVMGGDGMVNTIGSELVQSPTALGVIPAGSGNGFARHFGIPLKPEQAAKALVTAERRVMDVGRANERPFFVTCSFAADAALVRTFEKMPIRGIVPYVFAAATEFLGYRAQPFEVELDDRERMCFIDPMVFTAANLSQFGAGAQIAPQANPTDGFLELVAVSRQDAPRFVAGLNKLFDGRVCDLPGVFSRRFQRMRVRRRIAQPIQLDGEVVEAPNEVIVRAESQALTVLVPRKEG